MTESQPASGEDGGTAVGEVAEAVRGHAVRAPTQHDPVAEAVGGHVEEKREVHVSALSARSGGRSRPLVRLYVSVIADGTLRCS